MTEKYEHAYEVYKIIMEDYRSESKAEDRKVARDLHRAKGLGKAANFIWQKNWEAAATRFNRTQKEINELADMYSALRFQIAELRYNARILKNERNLRRERVHSNLQLWYANKKALLERAGEINQYLTNRN